MAKKSKKPAKSPVSAVSVTPERFVRLYRMVKFLADCPQTPSIGPTSTPGCARFLPRSRSSPFLRRDGHADSGRYNLKQDADNALALLPFPVPRLTLGAATMLAEGTRTGPSRVAETIARIVPAR